MIVIYRSSCVLNSPVFFFFLMKETPVFLSLQRFQLERVRLQEVKRSSYEHTKKCADQLLLLGQVTSCYIYHHVTRRARLLISKWVHLASLSCLIGEENILKSIWYCISHLWVSWFQANTWILSSCIIFEKNRPGKKNKQRTDQSNRNGICTPYPATSWILTVNLTWAG